MFFFKATNWLKNVHVTGVCFFFSSRRRHTRCSRDWSSDVCSSDLVKRPPSRGREKTSLFSDQFRRGESEKGKLSGAKSSKLVSNLSDIAWKAFQSVNTRLPEGDRKSVV